MTKWKIWAYTSDVPVLICSRDKTMPDTPPIPSSLVFTSTARFFPFHPAWLGIMMWIDPLLPSRTFRPDILSQANEIYRDGRDTQRVMKQKGNHADWGRHKFVMSGSKNSYWRTSDGCQGPKAKNGKSWFARSLSPNLSRPSCIMQHAACSRWGILNLNRLLTVLSFNRWHDCRPVTRVTASVTSLDKSPRHDTATSIEFENPILRSSLKFVWTLRPTFQMEFKPYRGLGGPDWNIWHEICMFCVPRRNI